MKKKIIMIMLAMCMVFSSAACGSEKENTEAEEKGENTAENTSDSVRLTTVAADEMDQYITLGEYKGITVENAIDEITEEDIDEQITYAMQDAAEEVTDEDAVVQNGDIVNIDYEGTLNGEAFDGGTDQGYDLTIGSGTFIDGFEEGLIGAKKGEELDLNLTFPEEYPSDELAGQDVVFHTKINSIKRPQEITDEWVKENTGFEDLESYRENVRTNMEASAQASAESSAKGTAWNQVMESSEVIEYPEADIETEKEIYTNLMTQAAEENDMTLEEMLEASSMTQEDFDAQCQEYAETMVKQNLVVQSILDKEGITLDGEEAQAALDELLQSYGVETKEDMISQYGEQAVNESIGVIAAGTFVADNAVIENVINTADGKNGVDGDAEETAAEE